MQSCGSNLHILGDSVSVIIMHSSASKMCDHSATVTVVTQMLEVEIEQSWVYIQMH